MFRNLGIIPPYMQPGRALAAAAFEARVARGVTLRNTHPLYFADVWAPAHPIAAAMVRLTGDTGPLPGGVF